MGGWDRSRSPRKNNAHWISKQIAMLGRYTQNRPANLQVDSQGCLTLQNLMDSWGHENGLSEQEVVDAVNQNLVCERTGGTRFKIHYDNRTGDTVIQVHRGGGDFSRDSNKNTKTWAKPTSSWKSGNDWNAKQETNTWKQEETTQSWNKKSDWDNSYNNGNAYRDSWVKEEPKTETWQNNRGNNAGWRLQGSQSSGSSSGWQKHKGGGHTQDQTEQIQRYMGYLLKNGSKEGVETTWGGYAPLSQMVTAMQTRKPDFGITDVESLKQFLQATDHEGRFHVNEKDQVKKIDRNERQNGGGDYWKHNSYAATPPAERRTNAEQRAAEKFNAFGATPAYANMHKEEADYGDEEETNQASPGVADVKVKQEPDKPKKPPGKHWTQYDDNMTIWWYYEGPKGVWWMGPEHSEPQPYNAGSAPNGDDE